MTKSYKNDQASSNSDASTKRQLQFPQRGHYFVSTHVEGFFVEAQVHRAHF